MQNEGDNAQAPTFALVEDILSSLRTSRSSRFRRPRSSRSSRTSASSSSSTAGVSNSSNSNSHPTPITNTRDWSRKRRPGSSPASGQVRSPLRSRNGQTAVTGTSSNSKESASLQALKTLRIEFFAEVAKKGSPSKSSPAERERLASYLSNKYLAQRLDALPPSNAVRAIRKEIASSIDIIASQAAKEGKQQVEAEESKTTGQSSGEVELPLRNRSQRRRKTPSTRQEWPGKKQETPREQDAEEETPSDENAGPELWCCNICGKKNEEGVGRCVTCGRGRHAKVCYMKSI